MRESLKKVVAEENDIVGNLTRQYLKNNIRAQRQVHFSADHMAGNTVLGYHRGLAWGRAETVRDIVKILRKKFPEASKYIKTTMEYDYKYK